MGKSRWTHTAPRTADVDWGKVQARQAARMRADTAEVVVVVRNVYVIGKDESADPMVLVAPLTHIMSALYKRYGRKYVGEARMVTTLDPWGLPTYQVCVMDAPSKDYITNDITWEQRDAWVLGYVAQPEQPDMWLDDAALQTRVMAVWTR